MGTVTTFDKMDRMGNLIAYYWYDAKVEPMTGMTKYEVYLVQKSWKVLNADPIQGGALIFKRLFIAYPETKEFFRTIRHVAEDDLATNGQFKAHALNFMSNFNNFVTNLQQPEVSAALMNKLGESHAKRKIKEGHFRDLKIVLTGILRNDLHLDETTVDAWSKTVDFMCKHIFETMSKTGKE